MEIIAIKEFVEFLKSKIDFTDLEDNEVNEEMDSFLSKKSYSEASTSADSGSDSKKDKKKKDPTFYILFMKNNKFDKTNGKGEYIKNVANMWKNSEKGQFFSERCVELKKENSDLSNEVIYDSVDQEWVELEKNKDKDKIKKKSVSKKIHKEKTDDKENIYDSEVFTELGEI